MSTGSYEVWDGNYAVMIRRSVIFNFIQTGATAWLTLEFFMRQQILICDPEMVCDIDHKKYSNFIAIKLHKMLITIWRSCKIALSVRFKADI
jgi:hypothetical protein